MGGVIYMFPVTCDDAEHSVLEINRTYYAVRSREVGYYKIFDGSEYLGMFLSYRFHIMSPKDIIKESPSFDKIPVR